jgi:hypothetical protein
MKLAVSHLAFADGKERASLHVMHFSMPKNYSPNAKSGSNKQNICCYDLEDKPVPLDPGISVGVVVSSGAGCGVFSGSLI